ncbi:uncharacterized protein LOC123205163 isoform X1 [Mangifera indica]|uniref:uncharacterized protein LOC123205163 isoform X1 n=1 Tax=Mangifera indica TaxID=29780 RepID=UPI001CFB9030|nr:uncharacterized protein LOC123205163 isoform X1 [Mangifera indica]XP_044477975.1 uncharacterized protein LOC123205163 isoform X1 [Mangifera indica]XP_044477976.1 uncharacterized protein LOC123205163 isoform X1 [Mangifera indica]XP_044477977.1 uncharacterized protein LOC123205163 isoform X1 [Mangifera indica]XP_044477978.1 uncharacterized protein LOC123205163 isoform X1 [Mangifera indica]XP_044477979.1 uncharacterized protein LOC123205163 isoform X1 [Mangifera indica]XP_044477980.1 uncharac
MACCCCLQIAANVGSVLSPVLEVAKLLAVPIRDEFKYLLNYKTNFVNLQEQVDKLKSTRDQVQRKVTAAEKNVEEIKQNVKDWQKKVNETITEADQLIQEMSEGCARHHNRTVTEAERNVQENEQELRDLHLDQTETEGQPLIPERANNRRCFKGFCPNFIFHYKQSKKAVKLTQDAIDLQEEKELDPVSKPSNPPREIWLRTSEDYLTFESRNSTMKNVWDALKDEGVFMIGVYGMGGLGKTTLVQEIGRKAEKENLFKEIVFVEVSESPDIKKIQTTIAAKLKLNFENESEMANKLYSRMMGKNILLILDNIWEDLNLKTTFGIPDGADRGRNKLLFTTRNVDVLKSMGSTKKFEMDFLNEDEAWILFAKMAGNVIQTPGLNDLPNDICKECGGLPIVICTIAKALRDMGEKYQWVEALEVLRAPSIAEFNERVTKEYTKIKLSYDYLKKKELKITFIICSLMENDASILDLLKNIMSMRILPAKVTIDKALDILAAWVDNLKHRCLLLDGRSKGRFSMHDVIRVIALTCAYIDYHVYTERNDVEKDKDKLGQCTIISSVGTDIITQLWSEELNCSKLKFFQASQMSSSLEIPEGFFIKMPELRALNLFEMQQSLLSLSIDRLINLQTLRLDGSKIEDVTVIGTLKKLKVLSLQNTLIKEFHTNMGQLTNLELLDLSYCRKLKVIASNVISQLSKLEAFYIKSCSIEWNCGLLEEVKFLSKLTILELDVEDINVLPEGFFSKELKRYNMSIGQLFSLHFGNYQLDCWRILQFEFNSTICLEKLHGIKNVQVLQLEESSVEENDILQSNKTRPLFNKKVILTDLMTLELLKISFEMIWERQLSTSSCENLTQLFLHRCNKIKYVFPFSVAKSLKQLRFLTIKDCTILEKIIKEEGAEVVDSIFPQLTKLRFRDLPKLRVFYQGVHALELPILKRLKVRNCPNFTGRYQYFQKNNEEEVVLESKSICLEHKINSDLEVMNLRNDLKDDYKWIKWCGKDKTLNIYDANISVELLQGFSNVKDLDVVLSSLEPNWMSKVTLTDLKTLDLFNISSEMIWGSQLSTPSSENLTKFILAGCDNMKYVFPFFVAKSLNQLQFLEIRICDVLEQIIKEEEGAEVVYSIFPQLTRLKLYGLAKLRVFYQGVHALKLPKLKRLEVQNCPNFTRRYQYFQDNNEDGEVEVLESKSFCLEHKINSDLEVITMWDDWKGEMGRIDWSGEDKTLAISHANISVGLLKGFCNLKVLRVTNSSLEPKLMSKVVLRDLMTLELDNVSFEMIWESQLSTSFYENLTKLIFDKCNNIKYVFSFFVAKSLKQLRFLEIKYCKVLENIIKEEGAEVGYSIFPQLTNLILDGCDNMKYVFPFFVAKSLKQLQFLEIEDCKILEKIIKEEEGAEVVYSIFPQLTKLKLRGLLELRVFYQGVHALKLPILKRLEVQNCPNFARRYQYFQDNNEDGEVEVLESKSFCLEHKINSDLEVITLEDDWEGETRGIDWSGEDKTLAISHANISVGLLKGFYNLKVLRVTNSSLEPKLMSKVVLRDLMTLELDNISFEMIWESQLSTSFYENLTKLILHRHNKIKYALPFFVAKSLKQLQCLQIRDCKALEKIVEKEEEERIEVVNSIFPRTTELVLQDLPKLTVFYQGAHALDLPLLKELKIENCPNFTSRCEGFQDNNEKGEVQVSKSKSICLEHKINSNLEVITLRDDWKGEMRRIDWCGEVETLDISHVNISVGLLQRFHNLKVLKIINCLGLIRRLITPSMAKSLVQLREMTIEGCKLLTEIVENEGDETTTEIVFNNLKKLSLLHLDYLTCFYSGNYSFNFPSLKKLIIEDCPSMKTFSVGSLSAPKLRNVFYEKWLVTIEENDLNTIIQKASQKRVNSDLKKLTLSGRDIMSIWQGKFEKNFDKVGTLELIKDEHTYIPIHIFTKFISLEQLELTMSSYEEIFSCEESEEHVGALAQLNVLQLCGLFNLKCIWKQDSQFKSILQNLHELSVMFCHNLMTLLSCSSSFKNLTTLKVFYCNGLQNLSASSTVKSLVCLENLQIEDCEMMKEVLANDGDIEEDEIVCEKLKELTLVKLKSLKCFYSGNCALNFPFLESLNVSKCFKMKTFSGEGLNMPMLWKVNKKFCMDDLNSIIQQLQNDCSGFCDKMTKEYQLEKERRRIHGSPHFGLSHSRTHYYDWESSSEEEDWSQTARMEDEEKSSNV